MDATELMMEIAEREQLIESYQLYGGFDVGYAIAKIKDFKKYTDSDVNVDDLHLKEMMPEQLLRELQIEIGILMGMLSK